MVASPLPLLLLPLLTLLLCHWLHHAYCHDPKYIIGPLSFLNYFSLPSILHFFFHSFLPCSLPSCFLPLTPIYISEKKNLPGEVGKMIRLSPFKEGSEAVWHTEVTGQERWRYWCTLVIPENEIGGMLGIDQVKSISSWQRRALSLSWEKSIANRKRRRLPGLLQC